MLTIVFFGCNSHGAHSHGLAWLPFNRDDITRSLDSGEYVLVFGNPLYHTEGKALKLLLQSKEFTQKLKQSHAKLYYLEYSTEEPAFEEIVEFTYRTYSPILAILHKSSEPKYFSIDELEQFKSSLKHIEKLSPRSSR